MKRIHLVFILFIIGIQTSLAQKENFSFGPKIGLNVTTVSKAHDGTWIPGLHAGGFALYRYNQKIGFQGDLMFSMMGANMGVTKFRINYISLPVMVKFYTSEGFALDMGVQLGFRVSDHFDNAHNTIYVLSVDGRTNPLELGILFGASYEFKFGMIAGFRYVNGLTNIYREMASSVKAYSKNQMFQFSVGWKI